MWSHGRLFWLGLPALVLLVGCESNPTETEVHDEALTVELTLSSDHVHILSPITFTAVVRDDDGNLVTDMDTLRVERKAAGTDTWRTAADLQLSGTSYTGEYTFVSSGEYELRVLGLRAGHSAMEEMQMATAMEPIHAARAHAEAGGYRIEFETFPGHIHEGNDVEFKFWIMETERDPQTNERPPIAGLEVEVHCGEPDGTGESHQAMESEGGTYSAIHTFVSVGDGGTEIHFTGADGAEASASFPLHIVHAH